MDSKSKTTSAVTIFLLVMTAFFAFAASQARARWYDPERGRFISCDPIGYDDGPNVYSFVANDPIDFSDPTGLKKCVYRWMLITYYDDAIGSYDNNLGPGSFATANGGKGFPQGSTITIGSTSGTVDDTGAGWNGSHWGIDPGYWLDQWDKNNASNGDPYWAKVLVCSECDNFNPDGAFTPGPQLPEPSIPPHRPTPNPKHKPPFRLPKPPFTPPKGW